MYIFHVKAPCEAEASCAALVKSGKVYATATEDMDGLTFGTTVLLRHLTASEAKYVWIRFISEIVFGYIMVMEMFGHAQVTGSYLLFFFILESSLSKSFISVVFYRIWV